jgi:hexosaminidase
MNKLYLLILAVLFAANDITWVTCAQGQTGSDRYGIIPKPLSLKETEGVFKITAQTVISVKSSDARVREIAEDFALRLKKCAGISLQIVADGKITDTNCIIFNEINGMKDEAYNLDLTPQQIKISASSTSGMYYGVQTIYQLLPPEIYGEKLSKALKTEIPCCEIKDEPRFAYRGLMLDVGRYFMPKESVMKFIDIMAMHKQNMFHWHLTEDQGWRIEIKKYPRLTEIGSMRKETSGYGKTGDGVPHGGFYTQGDIKEIVEYARKRCVTVVPEIELPGHAMAAIAAYPELSCFPERNYEVATSWGIKKDVFCPTAVTFRFLEDVFTELFELFPSPYYHIGGDECPRDVWKESPYCQDLMKILGIDNEDGIQIFFVRRMAKFLKEKGRKTVIGWDEILDGGAVPGTVVMSYRGHAPAVRAVKQGMQTILTANRWNYLDYYQEDPEKEEKSQGLFLPLKKVYDYFPIPDTVPAEYHNYFIGQQGCVWTEFIQTPLRAEYMAFPRAAAMSEVAWCPQENKDWESFCKRMLKDFKRMDAEGVNYSHAFFNVVYNFDRNTEFPKNVALTIDYPEAEIHYTVNGKDVGNRSAVYTDSIQVNKGDIIRAQAFSSGKKIGKQVDKTF